jgi:protein-disulfide isomerase
MQLRLDAADRLVELVEDRRGPVPADEAARKVLKLGNAVPTGLARTLLAEAVAADARLRWAGDLVALAAPAGDRLLLEQATYVVFDLETTGLRPGTSRPCEIGAVRVRGLELTERFQTLANPGAPASAPRLDLYEDFQCPVCGRFESLFGAQVTQLAEQNRVRLVVHTLSFLDDNLRNDSSSRSANAAACADDQGKFLAYHNAVFAGQPANEGDGYTDAQLTTFAQTAGITGSALQTWQTCYSAKAHNQYVQSVQTQADKDGVNGTPTIKLNGTTFDLSTLSPQSLDAAIKAATK